MGVDRHEPIFRLYRETTKHRSCREKYEQASWVTFLEKFKGHHEGGTQIDFPQFLWISLNKMVRGVKSTSKKPETSRHHHGLVKILVVHSLRTQGGSWKQLLQ